MSKKNNEEFRIDHNKSNNAIINDIKKNKPKLEKQVNMKLVGAELIHAEAIDMANIKGLRAGIRFADESNLSKEDVELISRYEFFKFKRDEAKWEYIAYNDAFEKVSEEMKARSVLSSDAREDIIYHIGVLYKDKLKDDIYDSPDEIFEAIYYDLDLITNYEYNVRGDSEVVYELFEIFLEREYGGDIASGDILVET